MREALSRLLVLAGSSFLLASCGLQPLYSGGTNGVVASQLGNVQVEPIAGKAGWLMRNALNDQLGTFQGSETKYRLVIELDDKIAGFGVRSNDRITRERRTLRARYQLVRLSDSAVVIDATAGSDAGIDVVSSEFATVAAEDTALENLTTRVADQIVKRLSLFALEQDGS
ncbi:LPS-assembly lipoprotein [Parasphingorhabdus marina DSM 22363]|uniref:LPS-assembly lipoprotein n=1 Tax=Parasphingorhabdus marina DSM 22363 TaxID=1123272 RepID=A0A1N6CNH7_9SPHN|nr:LPS assembly lipoprotein LptE [Parasphingorhabdus marina]SIN60130.1 LPS-assembly lipoprotein [Parasphingorhabdus marina DSM 22363]